jgi:glycosyltransferase involved in cell wall biosynthesis
VHIASWNTKASTELSIRTTRRLAGHPHEIVVGDGGSTDGSVGTLRELEREGWIRLEEHPGGRSHADWLDHWTATCPSEFAAFVDSDVEFLREGWLRLMVDAATASGADLVYAEALAGAAVFTVPRSGEVVELAPRPAPWLFLVRVARAREVEAGFAEHAVTVPGTDARRVYDVGGWFFDQASAKGLRVHVMDSDFRRSYRHFGGMSWREGATRLVEQRLRIARARDEGKQLTAARLDVASRLRERAARAAQLASKVVKPKAWRARRERLDQTIPWTEREPD